MKKNLTDSFIEGLYAFQAVPLTDCFLEQAEIILTDYIGVTLAGAKLVREKCLQYLTDIPYTCGKATVIGFDQKTDIYTAILINGICAHAAELDDGHRFGMVHPAAPIISALFSIAELYDLTGANLVRGIIGGYETTISLACAMQPEHREKGYHTTGTIGTIGAAMAIGTALQYTKPQLKSTLSAAVTSTGGLLEVLEDCSELKPYNAGRAALNGYVSAVVGQSGFLGPDDILFGRRGLFAVLGGSIKTEWLNNIADEVYMIHSIYRKQYAACRHCHAPIEASLSLQSKSGFSVADIKSVKVYTYQTAITGHAHHKIQGVNSAKMSIPYSVAVALYTGRASITEFTELFIGNTEVMALTHKTTVLEDNELTALAPGVRAARLEIETKDGRRMSKQVDYPKGEPENPMSREDIEAKFKMLAMFGGKTEQDVEQILKTIRDVLNQWENIYQLV